MKKISERTTQIPEPKGERNKIDKIYKKLVLDSKNFREINIENGRKRNMALIKQAVGNYQSERKEENDFNKEWSAFRFDHSEQLNQLNQFWPRLPLRLFERYLGFPVSFEELKAERAAIANLLGWNIFVPANNPCGTLPIITDAPEMLRPGVTHTIIGSFFGNTAGTLILHLDTPLTNINLQIDRWSDTGIQFTVPTTGFPNGIAFDANGTLILRRNTTNTGNIRCSTTISTVFQPDHVFLIAESSVSRSNWDHAGYSKNFFFKSPPLPPRAVPHLINGSDVLVNLSSTLHNDFDDPPSFTIVSGPFMTPNRERIVTVGVTDDFMWDFTLNVAFVIRQPADEITGQGWTLF